MKGLGLKGLDSPWVLKYFVYGLDNGLRILVCLRGYGSCIHNCSIVVY